MPAIIEISVAPGQYADLQAMLAGLTNGLPRALTVAVNNTARTGRSRIAKRISKHINMPAGNATNPQPGTVSRYLGIRKANWDKPTAAIVITGEGIPMYRFDPSPSEPGVRARRGGVSVRPRRGKGGRQVIRRTFIARFKSGHVGVFKRVLDAPKRVPQGGEYQGKVHLRGPNKGKPILRQPIYELKGPTPVGAFENAPGVSAEVLSELGEVLVKNMYSQADRLLNPRYNDRTQGDSKGAGASDGDAP